MHLSTERVRKGHDETQPPVFHVTYSVKLLKVCCGDAVIFQECRTITEKRVLLPSLIALGFALAGLSGCPLSHSNCVHITLPHVCFYHSFEPEALQSFKEETAHRITDRYVTGAIVRVCN